MPVVLNSLAILTSVLGLLVVALLGLCGWLFLERRSFKNANLASTAELSRLTTQLQQRDLALGESNAQRAKNQARLHRLETQLERSLEFSGVAAFNWNTIENVVVWNGPVEQVFGVKRSQLVTYDAFLQSVIPEDRSSVSTKVRESAELGCDYNAEFRICRPDGEVRWLAGLGGTVTYNGKPVQMSGVNFDITARKEAEAKLRASEERFREMVDALPQMVWIAAAGGEIQYRNRQWYRIAGLEPKGSEDEVHRQVLHPEDFARWQTTWAEARYSGDSYEIEYRFWDAGRGEYRWMLNRASKVQSGDKDTLWYGTCIDIHERKLAEANLVASQQSLLERENQLSLLFESGLIGNYSWDVDENLVYCHPIIWQLYGEAALAAIEKPVPADWFRSRQHPNDLPFIESEVAAMLEGERPLDVEFRVVWPDGSVHWLECRANVTRFENGKPALVSGINIDITERKNAALAIAASEEQFRVLANSVPLVVWIAEEDGRISYINRRWFQMVGAEPAQPVNWQSAVHPDDVQVVTSVRDHSRRTGTPYEVEIRLWNSTLREYRWHLARSVPLRDHAGRIQRWVGCSAETHDQKAAKDLLESQVSIRTEELRQSLHEKETLLKEIHHRVKNNLQIVSSLLKMQTEMVKDRVAQEALNESRQRVYSMALIHERLYGTDQMDEIDFADYASGLVNELRYSAARSSDIEIRIEAVPILLNVEQAIPCGLILNELVTNALKYAYPAGQGGEVIISLKEQPSRRLRLTVADRGVGLPAGFQLGATETLGLSIVEILSRQIGGILHIDTNNGGTAFAIDFPLPDKPPVKPTPVRNSVA